MFLARLTWATALAGLLAAPALAASDDIEITGSQDYVCVLNLKGGLDSEIILALDPDGDAKLNAPITGEFEYGDSYCNISHNLRVTVAHMALQGPPPGPVAGSDPFKSRIDFTAVTENWALPLLQPANTAGTLTRSRYVNAAYRNDADMGTAPNTSSGLTVKITTESSGTPLLFGDYLGSITVGLEAQP